MALAAYTPAARTLAQTRTADASLLADAWKETALMWSTNEDILGQWEGKPGSGQPVCVETQLTKGLGDRAHFPILGDLGGAGKQSDDELEGFEEFPDESTFALDIDQLRHAVSFTQLKQVMTVTGGSLESVSSELLGRWLGARKQTHALMRYIKSATSANTLRPSGKTADNLLTADTISTALVDDGVGMLQGLGANPGEITIAESGARIESYLCFGADRGLLPLKDDDRYEQMTLHATERGDSNPLHRGGYAKWNGQTFYHWNVRDGKTRGPLACPLTPKAKLGDAVVAGTAAFNVYGSGKTQAALLDYASYYLPFEWFKGYDFLFTKKQAAAPDASTYYFIIYNVTGADAGKFGVYSYTGSGNNGNRITIAARLGATAAGIRVTSLAGQTWSGALHTDAHPTGSLIIPVNAKCVPTCYNLFLGAGSLYRCYGKIPVKKLTNERDYSERKGMGIKSIFGQAVAVDTDQVPSGYVLFESAYSPVGVRLPAVTS